MAKLDRDEYVALSVLERICLTLDCDIGDVVEIVKNPRTGVKTYETSFCF